MHVHLLNAGNTFLIEGVSEGKGRTISNERDWKSASASASVSVSSGNGDGAFEHPMMIYFLHLLLFVFACSVYHRCIYIVYMYIWYICTHATCDRASVKTAIWLFLSTH